MKKILSFPRKNKISLEQLYSLEDLYIDDYTCISGYIAEPLYALAWCSKLDINHDICVSVSLMFVFNIVKKFILPKQ